MDVVALASCLGIVSTASGRTSILAATLSHFVYFMFFLCCPCQLAAAPADPVPERLMLGQAHPVIEQCSEPHDGVFCVPIMPGWPRIKTRQHMSGHSTRSMSCSMHTVPSTLHLGAHCTASICIPSCTPVPAQQSHCLRCQARATCHRFIRSDSLVDWLG